MRASVQLLRAPCAAVACALAFAAGSPLAAAAPDDSHISAVGIEAATASAPHDTVLYDAGLDVALLLPMVDVGLAFTGSSAPLVTGDRIAFNFAPHVGYHEGWRNDDHSAIFQIFTDARVPIQFRSGADLAGETGIALGAEAGVRLWRCATEGEELEPLCFGITLAARYQFHASEFELGPAVLPSGSSVLSFPISIQLGGVLGR